MKTFTPAQIEGGDRKWYVIDATGLTLGRLATQLAVILKGKNKASYAPHLDNGDYVVVTNCDKFKVTGKKMTDKMYHSHTGYLGGLKEISLEDLLVKKPQKALEFAVSGMLPKNKLRRHMISRLKLFTGDEHTFGAQKPELIK
ncbi:50S ribosomal protein L13 [Candidatus Gracilibacteria bacterium 28_42_T64]|nr:50S ribosomal protein L13 [Candidatus Gracilibacteria bacterium 28_42_T64]